MALLTSTESRFPLTCGRVPDASQKAADDAGGRSPGRRPFRLRFFVRDTVPPPAPAFAYCERQQVTVDEDGRPVVHGPTAAWKQTSTGNMDGNEETKMDQDPDSN